jgi:hypothetical protein
MFECRARFTDAMIHDCLLQIISGLKVMHQMSIIHQQLNDKCLHVSRSNQYYCGYRIIIGGFENSGAVVLGQSPLNPRRPQISWDVRAFYELGKKWHVKKWPLYESLDQYYAWLWLEPIPISITTPSSLLLLVLKVYQDKYPAAKRILYTLNCGQVGHRLLQEPLVVTVTSDAELLAMAVDLQNKAAYYSHAAANTCYRTIIELLELVLWETPEHGNIMELKRYIAGKITYFSPSSDFSLSSFVNVCNSRIKRILAFSAAVRFGLGLAGSTESCASESELESM